MADVLNARKGSGQRTERSFELGHGVPSSRGSYGKQKCPNGMKERAASFSGQQRIRTVHQAGGPQGVDIQPTPIGGGGGASLSLSRKYPCGCRPQ